MKIAQRRIPGLLVTDHEFQVPFDAARPGGESISVFAREVSAVERDAEKLPWMIFFQGGPGYPGPRVLGRLGWIRRAVEDYRVLLLDDRGTGRSEQVCAQSLARRSTAQERGEYLTQFRADAIVRDAEHIRRELLGSDGKWTALGQSFGGFCVTQYLSAAPEGLEAAIITGGLTPLGRTADEVYRSSHKVLARKNRLYYERYPEDRERVRRIVQTLEAGDVRLPCGERLSRRRFLQLGLQFGFHDGFEQVHYHLETAFVKGRKGPELGYPFLCDFEALLTYRQAPIFSMLQEACYSEGPATNWAAERVRAEYPEFERDEPEVLFTGEMMFRWMFEDYAHLRQLREEAEYLAAYDRWPNMHDVARLGRNEVPAAAVIYADDMYVDRTYSEETAAKIRGLKVWLTNEYEHNGIRSHGEEVLGKLLSMVKG
jgi:pimeloyl-ACP methyl ester carboxylesterase